MMGILYGIETHTVNYHLKRILSDSELEEEAVIRNFRITAIVDLIFTGVPLASKN
jgi:hypothetical protein